MGKVTIVNKKGIAMTVSEKLASSIGGVKPKILPKPPELEPVKPAELKEPEAAPETVKDPNLPEATDQPEAVEVTEAPVKRPPAKKKPVKRKR